MRSARAALALALVVPWTGCVLKRTPEARFFALHAVSEASPPPEAPADAVLVGVLPVLLPGHLERPQVVTWAGPGEVKIDEFLRWAEPLDAGMGRVLAENLSALLPTHRVIRAPWPGGTALRCRLRLEVARFGPEQGGQVELSGRWALLPERSERPLLARAWSGRRTPSAPVGPRANAAASVEAMSALLGELSRDIAGAIASLPAPEPEPAKDQQPDSHHGRLELQH
jgi:uncharacterized protein